MIDLHTHPCGLRDQAAYDHFERTGEVPESALGPFREAVSDADRAVVLALWAPAVGFRTSNAFVADVIRRDPARLVGFATVDPTSPGAADEVEEWVRVRGFRGVKLAPIYQRFSPVDPALGPLYERIQRLGAPVMWHQGTSLMVPEGPLEEARPFLLDRVARDFPGIRMVIAHFGYPWPGEVVALLRKHAHVYTDVSVLAGRPWFLYNALVAALEYGAADKVLLGSDYPAGTARETAAALRRLNDLVAGTGLPRIPEEVVEGIINRDSLALLGIPREVRVDH